MATLLFHLGTCVSVPFGLTTLATININPELCKRLYTMTNQASALGICRPLGVPHRCFSAARSPCVSTVSSVNPIQSPCVPCGGVCLAGKNDATAVDFFAP